MRPVRLELEGFGAFRDRTVVDFSDAELVALVGRTGSGKSTIIDGITFALFGSVARYDDKKIVAPVINQTSTRARVQLDFELGGRCYTVARLVQRTKAGATTKEARLEQAGDVLAADARSVTAEVERLLGLDADQFNRTVVLPQGRFADFLHDQPRDRQATLRNLLGLGVYQAIASAARRRAAAAKAAADALRPELDAGRDRLTPERRAALVDRRDAVRDARASFIALLTDRTDAEAAVRVLDERLADLDGQLALLDGLRWPDGLSDLERRRAATATALARATAAVAEARDRRRRADDAVAAGPDPVASAAQLEAHRAAAAAAADHEQTVARLTLAQQAADDARAVADAIARAQDELDAEARAARARADDARAAADEAGTISELQHWLVLRERHEELTAAIAATEVRLDAAARAVAELGRSAETAAAAEAEACRRHDDVRDRAGAAGFAALLRLHEPCPLCLQPVAQLPEHHVDAALAAAAAALRAATDAAREARSRLSEAEQHHARVNAQLVADRRTLDALRGDLADVPDTDELGKRMVILEQAHAALGRSLAGVRRAEQAAAVHRDDRANAAALRAAVEADHALAGLRALEGAQRTKRDETALAVRGLPAEAEVAAAIAEATRLAAEQRAAVATLAATEDALQQATLEQRATEAAVLELTSAARAARDRVAALGPPTLAGDGPAAAWEGLLAWADGQRRDRGDERAAVAASHADAATRLAALDGSARALVRAIGIPADGPLGAIRDALAQLEAAADAAIGTFDEDRARLEALAGRVAGHEECADVAGQLAHQLRTDRFEAWLMEAALAELVEAASVRLRELTGGQFSLALVDQAFMVRDHANADELRGARTLSGGETFLASLSLALALADATSELAPEGAPALESIFLDEGFGSLDPATLDTVAAAIEELGSAGRMVVVVTHIRELADRLPVRMEVTKTAASSTVERVDT